MKINSIFAGLFAVSLFGFSLSAPTLADIYELRVTLSGTQLDKSVTSLGVSCAVYKGRNQTGTKLGSGPANNQTGLVRVTNGRAALQARTILITTAEPAGSWRCEVAAHPGGKAFSRTSPNNALKVDGRSVLVTRGNIN